MSVERPRIDPPLVRVDGRRYVSLRDLRAFIEYRTERFKGRPLATDEMRDLVGQEFFFLLHDLIDELDEAEENNEPAARMPD